MQSNRILLISSLIFLSCSGNSGYTVSGTVKGLQGSLIIQNNSKDDLTIDQDGNFSFKTTLADKEKFNIQVDTEPCAQRCEIKSGIGTIDGKNVDNIEINCLAKTWTESENFLKTLAFPVTNVLISKAVMNRKGDIIVLWQASTDIFEESYYKSEFHNGIWTHPLKNEFIGIANLPGFRPAVALNDSGNAIMVWQQPNASGVLSIYKSEYKFGVWTSPTLLSDSLNFSGSTAYLLDVAMNNLGDIVVVWTNQPLMYGQGSPPGVFKSEFRKGKWTYPKNDLDKLSPGVGQPYNPKVVINDSGESAIAWIQNNGGSDDNLYKSEYVDGGWKNPISTSDYLSTPGAYPGLIPTLKINNEGDVLIAWVETENSSSTGDLRVAERTDGRWSVSPSSSIFTADYLDYSIDENEAKAVIQIGTFDLNSNITKIYKSERNSGKWDWPVSDDNFVNQFVKGSPGNVTIDRYDNIDLVWSTLDTNINIFDTQDTKNYQRGPTSLGNFSDINAYALIQPLVTSNECRKIIFWQSYSTNNTIPGYFVQYR